MFGFRVFYIQCNDLSEYYQVVETYFKNRTDAGKRLAMKLLKYKDEDAIVIALPRGGVVVAKEVAKLLDVPLDIVIVRKIGHKENPEYAIGAVSEDGKVFLGQEAQLLVGAQWLNAEIQKQITEAKRRRNQYKPNKSKPDIKDKTVIVVDDGVATGYTLMSALDSIKKGGAKKIIVGVPVAPEDTIVKLQKIVDEVVVAIRPQFFLGAIGAYYDEFDQVSDEQVKKILN